MPWEVFRVAKVDKSRCIGCRICELICVSEAIVIEQNKAKINQEQCIGCLNCMLRCPKYAIAMIDLEKPRKLHVDVSEFRYTKIREICLKANIHSKQEICTCANVLAEEVVAAILKGAKNPTDISRLTGARVGCKTGCILNIIRLLEASGITVQPKGWQWYGKTPTIWDIPQEIKQKYNIPYRLSDDEKFLRELLRRVKQ